MTTVTTWRDILGRDLGAPILRVQVRAEISIMDSRGTI
jgi:hypothetical protein